MAYTNSGSDPQVFASVRAALKRVGIASLGWAPDYPSGNGFLTLLVDGKRIQEQGTTNFVSVNDEVLNGLLERSATASLDEQAEIFRELDKETMDRALYIPYFFQKALLYRNPRVTNVDLRGDRGMYDFVNLGVS